MDGSKSTSTQQQQQQVVHVSLVPPPSPGGGSKHTSAASSRELLSCGHLEAAGRQGDPDGGHRCLSAGASQSSLQQAMRNPCPNVTVKPEDQPGGCYLEGPDSSQLLRAPGCESSLHSRRSLSRDEVTSVCSCSSSRLDPNGSYSSKPSPRASPRSATPNPSQHTDGSTALLLPVMHPVSRQEITNMAADSIPRSPLSKTLQINSSSRESQV